jgi:hypothetical protein
MVSCSGVVRLDPYSCFLLLLFVCFVIILGMAKPASIKDSYKSLKRLLSGEMGCSGQVIGFGFLLVMIGSTAAMVWFFYTGQHLPK